MAKVYEMYTVEFWYLQLLLWEHQSLGEGFLRVDKGVWWLQCEIPLYAYHFINLIFTKLIITSNI